MLKLAVLGLIVGVSVLLLGRRKDPTGKNAAFGARQPHEGHTDVRDAGPHAMRDKPVREWAETDEDLDESFPASDPPGGY